MNQRSGGIVTLLGFAAVFFLLKTFFPAFAKLFLILAGLAVLGVVALVAAVLWIAFRRPEKTPEKQLADDGRAAIQKGRSQLMEIRRLVMKIRHSEIRKTGESICSTMDKILRTLKEHPGEVPRVGRFFRYYLPTLQNVLEKYLRLETNSIPAGDTEEKTLAGLKSLEAAMEKQYLNLFEDDKLDLSVEMVVLTRICRQDGLLGDDFQILDAPADEVPDITLTL